jgi:hypothetical protein
MSEDNQLVLPASFIALFIEPGRTKPSEPRAVIQQRYGFCEDLASMLVDTARTKQWELGIAESDVLTRVHEGLLSSGLQVSQAEAQWVSTRLAELLEWEPIFAWSAPQASPG